MPELRQLTRAEPNEPTEDTEATEPVGEAEPAQTSRSTSTGEPAGTDPTFEVGGASVTVSGDPTEAEAAVVAAVVTEHLQTEAAAAETEESRDAVDPWCLSERLGVRSPDRTPRACPSGTEWKVAGRAATW